VADDQDSLLRQKRWRLALGDVQLAESTAKLTQRELNQDSLLEKIYPSDREGGLSSQRNISARWMGDIRMMFPESVVKIIQKDAIDRFGIKKMLSDPSFMQDVIPDVKLVSAILSVKQVLPEKNLQLARQLSRRLAEQISERLRHQLIDRLSGKRDRAKRLRNPKAVDIDWHLTIRENLKHYQTSLKTIIPHILVGHPRKRRATRKIILLVDQSASMADSFVYAGILGSIMSMVKSVKTHFVAFDTEVADLTEFIHDPVDLLFRSNLGGGTNIQKALGYALQLVDHGPNTHIILISDLYEGAPEELLYQRILELQERSVPMITLLALDDSGLPAFDKSIAKRMATLGVPSFACTPNKFPDLISTVLNGESMERFQSNYI